MDNETQYYDAAIEYFMIKIKELCKDKIIGLSDQELRKTAELMLLCSIVYYVPENISYMIAGILKHREDKK